MTQRQHDEIADLIETYKAEMLECGRLAMAGDFKRATEFFHSAHRALRDGEKFDPKRQSPAWLELDR